MAARKQPITQSQGEAASDQAPVSPEPQSSLSLLAQERFGADFHGEVVDTPPEPKPTLPQELPEIPDDDIGGGEKNVRIEGDDVDVDAEPDTPEAAEVDEDKQPIATVRELVDYLEAEPAWFDNLKVDVTVNGNSSQVPLKEVVESYRTQQAADERLELAKSKSTQAQQEFAERNAALDLQYQTAAKLVLANEQAIMAEAAAINWDQLKREDPAMWSAEQIRVGQQQQKIQGMKQQTAWEYQQVLQQRHQEDSQRRSVTLQEQSQLLADSMPKVSPDWADPQKVPQAKGRLATYLVGQGFTPSDIENTLDHRNFIVAEKARLWDESQGKMQIAKKRMRTVPKVMKPGAGREPSTVNLEKVRQAQAQLRKTGRVDDALTALRLLRQKRS